MKYERYLAWLMVLFAAATLYACGKSSSSTESSGTPAASTTGVVAVSLTDAPGDFDHAYITVKDIWFHTSDAADPRAGDWLKYPLTTPVTVDLLSLSSGNMQSLWNNIQLPVGTYQQIRLFLVGDRDSLTSSAQTLGLAYNNEVVVNGTTFPLHIPDADHGIKLIGTFGVTAGGTLRLAIDFDAGHDIVEFHEGTDYVLKPRLNYFDLDNVGAIIGKLSTGGSVTVPHFVIKAERLSTTKEMADAGAANPFHVVRRWTVPRADGTFILYPLSTLVTSTWDVVIRGLNTETMIIKGVPITKGTTAASGTDLATISTTPTSTSDYPVDGTIQSPTGAWVQFYQTLPAAGEHPYEIRFRHFNPLTGGFKNFKLNNDQIQVANFVSSGAALTFTPETPVNSAGHYDAVADAVFFNHSAVVPVTSQTATVAFTTPLTVVSPYKGNSVTGSITMHNPVIMGSKMNRGRLFAVHGGMIVDAVDVNSQMTVTTNNGYSLTNLPGGDATTPLPGAFYGLEAVGWTSSPSIYKAIAIPQIVDLRKGDDTANMDMLPLW